MRTDTPPRLLLADDQPDVLEALRLLLKPDGYSIETAASPQQLLRALELKDFDVVLMDLNYARDTTSGQEGLELLQRIHTADESLPVVVMTAWGTVNVAVEAMRRGARDFIQKPWDNERLLSIIRTQTELGRALRRGHRLEADNQALQADGHSAILAESPAMRPVLEMMARVGPSDANVLITGENGTGKSLIAQALHAVSPRANRPMVTVNVGGLSEGVFESELFGHVKGAFTDAKVDRVGRFELADASTLFLDEIANVPMTQQPKLLRVIETGEFERVGSSKTRKVNVRLVSATNADLNAEVDGRPLPPGPALPPEHDRDSPAAAARSPRGHSAARAPLPAPARAALSQAAVRFRPGRDAAAAGSPVARQRPRARSRHRARRADVRGPRRAEPGPGAARGRRRRGAPRRDEPRGGGGVPHQEGDGTIRQRQPGSQGAGPLAQRAVPEVGKVQVVGAGLEAWGLGLGA